MIPASKIKYVKSLGIQKFRRLHQQFVVEGPKMMDELFESDFLPLEIFATPTWIDENNDKELKWREKLVRVSEKEIARLSGLKTANKVLATVQIPERKITKKDFNKILLVLDGISDPGNLGTIIRTAEWFGIESILCSPDSVELYNPKVVQATMGSLFRVKVFYDDLGETIAKHGKGIPVFGTMLEGENIYNLKPVNQAIVVIGSESHGIRPATRDLLTHRITIPSSGSDAESLNASVATGIVCSEFSRERLK
jgi:TrmH family RNA methyltransferase